MAKFIALNLEEEVRVRLHWRAARNGRSMEGEVRVILRDAMKQDEVPAGGQGMEIASLFSEVGLDAEIRELRGHVVTPIAFKE